MKRDFHVRRGVSGGWIVVRPADSSVVQFRRRTIAEAYGRALAHRARVSLIVHHSDERKVRFSNGELTYAAAI